MKLHVLTREIAADRRSIHTTHLYGGQSHEPRGVAGAATKRPATTYAVAAPNRFSRTDSAGGAGNEAVGGSEPLTRNRFGQIAGYAAHSGAVCNYPADRTIQARCGFNHLHKLGWRQFRAAQRRRQPKAKQPGLSECPKYDLWNFAVSI